MSVAASPQPAAGEIAGRTRSLRRHAVAVLCLALLAFAGAEAWRPREHLADSRPRLDLETVFPKRFGEWRVDDRMPVQLVSPDVQALLNKLYSQVLSRVYVHEPSGRRVMLSVAYGGDQSDAARAHRPEVCYPAQGFDISGRQKVSWQVADRSMPIGQLVARLGSRQEPISYWFVVGEGVAISGTDQKLMQLRYGLRGVIPDGMLVRVSSVDRDVDRAYALHRDFVESMAAQMPPADRLRVMGSGD